MQSLTPSDYTERYVDVATRSLRPDQRGDYAAELRGAIEELIEDRVDRGEPRAAAEVAVLNGMGDPEGLAAGYADRPLQLIGPRWFGTWRRVMRIVLWSTLPFVALGVAIGMVLEGRPFWGVVGPTIAVTFGVGSAIFTVMTLVFAAIDRGGAAAEPWTVDHLPVLTSDDGVPVSRAEKIIGVVAVAAAVLGLVIVTVPWSWPGAGTTSVVNPQLWPWSLIVGLILIVAGTIVNVRARAAGRWGIGVTVATAVIAVVWAALIVGLLMAGSSSIPRSSSSSTSIATRSSSSRSASSRRRSA
ncbi:hypothetical protein ACFT30_00665 [Microbacterium ureisolvens]|uniref:hypothetical protein n=1 Tax=Microbacterium ureisolvens TaxID=2781186 RepID=UPI0036268C5B